MIRVSICVCTYRRPGVLDTLASLMSMEVPVGIDPEVIVIDNDDRPSARAAVETFALTAPLRLTYVHCPEGNISIARNGALDATSARYLAFIDDDETACPGWIAALLDEAARSDADIVLGPVEATYDDAAPVWMRETALHGTGPVWVEGEIRTGYSGNVLIDRACPALEGLRFDLALGKSGGEDTLFFGSAHKAGARIGYAPEALVRESVPASRMSLGWLGRRRFRMGRTHARLLVTVHRRPRWQAMPVALAKAGYCAAATLVSLPVARARNLSALRFLLHAGVVAGLFERFGQFPAHRRLSGADAE